MDEKVTGRTLLIAGIFIMTGAFLFGFLMFTGVVEPVKMFAIPAPSFNTSSLMPSIPGLPEAPGEKIEVLPTDAFNKVINLGVGFLLLTFTMSFGFKLSDLGVKLLRPVKIEPKL